jgi:hypothetical protein
MGKLFGIVLLVLGVWLAIEVYTKGSDQAFGGALTWLAGEDLAEDPSEASDDGASTIQRIQENVRSNMNAGAARTSDSGNPEAELDADDVMSGDADDFEE